MLLCFLVAHDSLEDILSLLKLESQDILDLLLGIGTQKVRLLDFGLGNRKNLLGIIDILKNFSLELDNLVLGAVNFLNISVELNLI